MGVSYIIVLTAFYVDNGKSLPLWRDLPQISFWLVPTFAGLPFILWAMMRHPRVLAQVANDTPAPSRPV
jgi:hypothetical protein